MALTAPNIRRNIAESADNIYINRWWTGEITNRSPLFTPISALGLQVISRHDTLWTGGQDMEISPTMTLVRRYGFSKFCTNVFGSNDYPLNYESFKNTSGAIALLVDTPTMVASFNGTTLTSLYSKGTTSRSSFHKVGDMEYICDGTDLKKWDQSTLRTWGIAAPATAPTVSAGAGSLSPTAGYEWGYCYKCSATGHYSTMSPASGDLGPGTNQQYTIGYTASSDPQVDLISIFRILDGGSLFYWVADVPNLTSNYVDNNADTALLNTAIIAPIAHSNDAPPSGLRLVTWHQDRLVGASGEYLYFSAGPDTITGVPAECWPPANVFTLPGTINALASTDHGLLVWTSADMFVMLGTDTASFWVKPLRRNFGVLSQNCIAQDGDTVFVYTSTSQLFVIDSSGLEDIGFNIQDQLASFSPSNTYLAIHRYGLDAHLWLSDGSANIKGYDLRFQAWMPTGKPSGGIGAIKSLETSAGVYALMAGRATGSGYILKRDTTTYLDDGVAYTCAGVIGSLLVAPPGDLSKIDKILLQTKPVGTYPTVSVLCDEISGTFVALPNPVDDPPQKAGSPFASKTVLTKRHWFRAAQQPLPELVNHLQVKISFPAENYRAEILGLGIG